ncbi:hypothetical protein HanRHA438_Chr01g0045701 [Helianthus annuus]|nr:hypothetical protein HanRHA438_Chr01g0045701 [Helianthus annuus]
MKYDRVHVYGIDCLWSLLEITKKRKENYFYYPIFQVSFFQNTLIFLIHPPN